MGQTPWSAAGPPASLSRNSVIHPVPQLSGAYEFEGARPKALRSGASYIQFEVQQFPVTTVDGKFTIHSTASGEYEIIVCANVDQAYAINPDLFKNYEPQAQNLRP